MEGLDLIEKLICDSHGVTPLNLKSHRRSKHIVAARFDFSNMAKAMGFDEYEIGEFMNKDRTTILHHWKKKEAYKGSKNA